MIQDMDRERNITHNIRRAFPHYGEFVCPGADV